MTKDQAHELRENTTLTAKVVAILTGNGGGDGGLQGDVKYIKRHMVSKNECKASRKTCAAIRAMPGKHRRSTWLVVKDVILVLLALSGLLLGSGVLMRISP